jgi:NarL family two-component system response regulator LiaR
MILLASEREFPIRQSQLQIHSIVGFDFMYYHTISAPPLQQGNLMSEKPIRVFIVDDQNQVRQGLTILLEEFDDLECIGEARNGQEAVVLVERLQPDVVLMDLMMPVMDGVSATRIIHQKFPHIRVIVLTSSVDPELIQSARDAGAFKCLFKNVTIDTLEQSIREAAA